MVTIGIIGGGNVGGALARGLAAAGHQVTVGLRAPGGERGAALATAGLTVTTPAEAAGDAEVVILAVPAPQLADVVPSLGSVAGTIVVDATNAVGGPVPGGHPTVFDHVVDLAPGALVVKAFNTIGAEHLAAGGGLFLPVAGHDAGRPAVLALAADLGFDPVDLGGPEAVVHVEAHARLWIHLAFARGFGRDFGFTVTRP
jgi:predicted dinucleotide-binding enzyme